MAATDAGEDVDAVPKKKGKLPLLLGLVLALGLGGGGFFAAYSGMLDAVLGTAEPEGMEADAHAEAADHTPVALPDVGYVPIEPLIISLSTPGATRHLRFRAELEVPDGQQQAVADLMPRILDILNGYLRAIPVEELEQPGAFIPLRAQLLRRIQLAVGESRVRDVLITEFVLN